MDTRFKACSTAEIMIDQHPGRLSHCSSSSGRKLISVLNISWNGKGSADDRSCRKNAWCMQRAREPPIALQVRLSNSTNNTGSSLGIRVGFQAAGFICLQVRYRGIEVTRLSTGLKRKLTSHAQF